MRRTVYLATLLLGLGATPAPAHYNMLLPQSAFAKKGEAVTFTYQWGHPFEHQLFDAPAPTSVVVLRPDGKKADLTKTLEKTTRPAAEGKKAVAYQFRYTPEERGDYVFVLQTPPIWMEEDGEYLQDTVKVVLHVQAQKGWESDALSDLELVPLTRPYGLLPGMVFQAKVHERQPSFGLPALRPVAGNLVEIERYNAAPPKELPADELITRTARTDPNGVVTTTLTDPGWWCLTTARDAGTKEREGKARPLRQRSTLWVFVEEKGPAK
jgi:uncharacterized GH25 family protein